MNREFLLKWLDLLLESETGEILHIPVEDKEQQRQLLKAFRKEVFIMSEVTPEQASKVKLYTAMKDSKLWIILEKVAGTPLVGFVKRKDGTTERVSIEDPGKWRRLAMMKQDGLSLKEIIDIEGELTEEEANFIKGG